MADRKVIRPSGWKGKMTDSFLLKDSKYGQMYFCTSCGKSARGTNFRTDRHHHFSWCERMVTTGEG
jgi:hypothetical protein